jgi:hypothetical protein
MFGKEPRVANSKRLLLNIISSEMFFIISFKDLLRKRPEAESKEKHGVWDPMQELTI